MAPAFSKIPVAPTPGISVVSGLMCSHADCFALFSNLEDSEAHAVEAHAGNVAAITCGIYKHLSTSGEIRLYRVLDENGERDASTKSKHFIIYPTASEGNVGGENALVPAHTQLVTVNGEKTSTDNPATIHGSSPASAQVPDPPLKTSEQPSTETLPSTTSALTSDPTPPSSQSTPSNSQPLSRQSTTSSLETISPTSSFNLNDAGDDSDGQLHRILEMVESIVDQCRICWVRKEVIRPHGTFRCPTRICSGNEWQSFRVNIPFPRGVVCYFCFALYGPPFNHARALPGTKQTADLCEYPDVLKELAYVLYQDRSLRERIFTRLGVTSPSTLYKYKQFVGKGYGGSLGVYKVICAYLDIHELEESSA